MHDYHHLFAGFDESADGVTDKCDILREVWMSWMCTVAGSGDWDAWIVGDGEEGYERGETLGCMPGARDENDNWFRGRHCGNFLDCKKRKKKPGKMLQMRDTNREEDRNFCLARK